jgi:sugar phosphate isomerase/epimerase
MTRKEFLKTVTVAAAGTLIQAENAGAQTPKAKFKRGVTLYSYQEEYYTHGMSLEDCIAEVASMGAEGIEVIAEEMVPNYPDPPEAWVQHWHGLMAKYHTKSACLDTFVDVYWGGRRDMTVQESVDTLAAQLKLANRMGFKVMRPTTGPVRDSAPEMIERALPIAEKYDVRIAPEIHAPIPTKGKFIDSYMEIIAKTKTKHLGFNPDMGIFAKRIPRIVLARHVRDGASEKVIQYLDQAFQDGVSAETRAAEAAKMSNREEDVRAAMMTGGYGPVTNKPSDLLAIMPYVYNVHGKFYEMTDDLKEYSIPYDEVMPVFIEGGYAGYINSEYEGQRNTQDIKETDSCEEIRRHHVMMKRLMGEE